LACSLKRKFTLDIRLHNHKIGFLSKRLEDHENAPNQARISTFCNFRADRVSRFAVGHFSCYGFILLMSRGMSRLRVGQCRREGKTLGKNMGIDIRLENERGEKLEEIHDPRNCLGLALRVSLLDNTVCLRFIDLYGDTVFNQQQIHVFVNELQWLLQFITPENVATLQDRTFQVYNLQTGLTENRVREKKLSLEEVREHIQKIIELAQRSKGKIHTYLKLYGD